MCVKTIRYSPGGPSAVMCSTPPETNILSGTTLKLAGGPSAPQGRTVRSPGADRPPFILENHQRQQCVWYKFSNSRRTVRTPGADRPPHRSSPQPEKTPSLVQFELERRTVRPPRPDCPPANLNSHSSSTGSLVRVRTVCATEADCPHLCSQLSNLIFFKSFENVVSPHACI